MIRALAGLIAHLPDDVERRVRATRERAGPVLRDALRAECRLVLRTPQDAEAGRTAVHVPVAVVPALPVSLQWLDVPDDLYALMLLNFFRTPLRQVRDGTLHLQTLPRMLREVDAPAAWMPPDLDTLHQWAQCLLDRLDQQEPIKTVLNVNEDVLGIYRIDRVGCPADDDRAANPARIELYWAVIGLMAQWLDCAVEDLAVVALAHELAHAYTQLGADIEGRRWRAEDFARVEHAVAEGLAQYYTERVLHRLARRLPGALDAFEAMLPHQPEVYRTHETWRKHFSPEAVRLAMLELRRAHGTTVEDFECRLATAQAKLEGV